MVPGVPTERTRRPGRIPLARTGERTLFLAKQVLDLSDGKGRPAQWTILLGENGTGKTTVLQLLAAFERMFRLLGGISVTRQLGVRTNPFLL